MNERLRKVRMALGLSQKDFSGRINIGYSTLAMLETGQRKIKDIHIAAICREFNVNEEWLRTGTGEMFNVNDPSADEQIIKVIHALGLEGIAARFVDIYLHLPDSEQDTIKRCIQQLLDSHQEPAGPPPETDAERADRLERKVQELQTALDASLKEEQQTMAPTYVKT